MLSTTRAARAFRRPLAATAIAAAACITVVPVFSPGHTPTAQAQTSEKCVSAAWGVRESFRKYISGKIARGGWEVGDGVTYQGDQFVFQQTFDPMETSGGSTVVPLGSSGYIHFTGHEYGGKPKLDTKMSDFKLEVTGSTAYIVVDYEANLPDDMSPGADDNFESGDDVAIAQVALGSVPDFTANEVDLGGEVTLTAEGDKLFLSQYGEGAEMDRLDATVTTGTDCAASSGGGGGSATPKSKKTDDPVLDALGTVNDYGTAINNLLSTTDKILSNADKLHNRFNTNGVSTNGTGAGPGGGAIGGATGTTGGGTANKTSAAAAGTTPSGGNTAGRAAGNGAAGGGAASTSGVQASGATGGGNSVCTADSSLGVVEAAAAWGVKQSFQSYITGSIAKGSWELSGVSHGGGEFHFSGNSGAVDPAAGTGTVLFPGTMFFTGHKGVLQLSISNLEIQWNGSGGSLVADVSSNDMEGNNTDFGRVALASLSFSQLDVNDTAASGVASASLTQAGSQAFAEFYPAGTELDPVSFSASLGGEASCAAGQGAGASGGGVASGGGDAAAAASAKAGGAAKAGAKGGAAHAAAKLGNKAAAAADKKEQSEGAGFDNSGSFKIKSAGAHTGDTADSGSSPFTVSILMIVAAFVVAGATLSQFVSRNPNSR